MGEDTSLELDAAAMRELLDDVVDRVVAHVASLDDQPAANVGDATAFARALDEPLPDEASDRTEVLDLLFHEAIPRSLNAAGPGYLAYIPGGGIFHAAVADLIADATNRYVGTWFAAPVLARMETNVLRWFCQMVGYPATTSGGILTSGGSLANFTATVAARRAKLADDGDLSDALVYTSDQAHHSVQKAALLAGIPPANVRSVPTDGAFRIRIDALDEAVRADQDAGRRPFLVVANAGTTNTGAVDDLEGLADLCRSRDLWLHADAAYGGFFVLTHEGRQALAGLERADSITLDPHKGLFLPYGTGALLVRELDDLRRAHAVSADYLPARAEHDLWDFSEMSPELSRDFRGLRVWLPLKLCGIGPFRNNLDEKWRLARWCTLELARRDHITIVAEPQLSLLAFRWEPPGVGDVDRLDEMNRALLDAINARQRVYLSGTTVGGRFLVRVCVISFRTHRRHLEHFLEDLDASMAELSPDAQA